MNTHTEDIKDGKKNIAEEESTFIGMVKYLIRSDLEWLGRIMLKILRFIWHDHTLRIDEPAKEGTPLPTGPFVTSRKTQVGDLLLWVPWHIDSYVIDDMTDRRGYSHVTIDSGEVDIPTGKPVMIESTIGPVSRKFLDEYGSRNFARVPISKLGVNVEQFVECIKSKMGAQYDYLDALTLGEIKNPAREICSGLAADCLPEDERQRIEQAKKSGLLRGEAVVVHAKSAATTAKLFVTPNGFAEDYRLPVGKKITKPDTLILPKPVEASSIQRFSAKMPNYWNWVFAGGVVTILAWIFIRKRAR